MMATQILPKLFVIPDHGTVCGVYVIVNSINETVYVGSAVNVRLRRNLHLSDLRRNKHHCPSLQNFFNKYGEDSLTFYVAAFLIAPTREEFVAAEQKYLDIYPSKFNVLQFARSSVGRKHSPESKEKMSRARKALNIQHSEEYKKQMSKRLSGEQNPNFGKKGFLHHNYGRKHKPETLELMKRNQVHRFGSLHPNFGKRQSEATTQKANQTKRLNQIKKHGWLYVTDSNGETKKFGTYTECGAALNSDPSGIRKAVAEGRPFKGFAITRETASISPSQ